MSDIEASVGQEVALEGQLAVTVSRGELAQKLSLVSRGVSTRTAVQILGGILLRAAGDSVELAATDMELSLRTPLGATVSGDGAVVVPGKLFADLSRLLPEGEVELEYRQDENVLQVRCGPAEYRLNTYSAEDFPRLPDAGATPTHTVDAASLLATVASVGRAVSRDEARPVLTGILVRFGEGKLVMAATDSYRLSYKETPIEGDVPELEVVRRTSVMAHRNSPLRLRFAEGEVTVWAQTQDVGEARETLPIRFDGEPLEIGFNADFLRDGIESAEGDDMRLRLIDPLRPGLIQGLDDDFWYLIMP